MSLGNSVAFRRFAEIAKGKVIEDIDVIEYKRTGKLDIGITLADGTEFYMLVDNDSGLFANMHEAGETVEGDKASAE